MFFVHSTSSSAAAAPFNTELKHLLRQHTFPKLLVWFDGVCLRVTTIRKKKQHEEQHMKWICVLTMTNALKLMHIIDSLNPMNGYRFLFSHPFNYNTHTKWHSQNGRRWGEEGRGEWRNVNEINMDSK